MLIKLLSATAILGVAIAGAYLLIPAHVPGIPTNPTNSNEIQQEIIGRSPRVESLRDNSGLTATAQQILSPAPIENQNLTNTLIKKIQENIREKNQIGPQAVEGQSSIAATPPDELVQQVLEEATANFSVNSFKPIIQQNSFNVVFDNNPNTVKNYFSQFQKIINSAASQAPKTIFTDTKQISNPEILSQLIEVYTSAFEALAPIQVPSSLISIHTKELELLGMKANILKQIKNFQNDPVTTIFAIDSLENVDNQFLLLDMEINTLLKTLKAA